MVKFKITAYIFLLTLFLIIPIKGSGQSSKDNGKRIVEILHTNVMLSEGSFRRLIGDVQLRHKEMYMSCDSAHYFEKTRIVKAYKNIHIHKGDSVHIYGEYLIYNSDTEQAEIIDSVLLIDNKTKLYTDHIYYDMANEVARYNTGGRIINDDNVLTSKIGIYYSVPEILQFKDSVKLVNPEYTAFSDTMEYNTITETVFFLGPSEIFGDSLYAKCNTGWYDTKNEISLLMGDAMIDNEVQVISGDSLYYEEKTGYGTAFYNVTISDRKRDIIIKGNKTWYHRDPEEFMVTDSAQFIQETDDGFLYVHADTLWSYTLSDSTGTYKTLKAWYGVRIFSDDLQAKCDSLSYSAADSIVKMYNSPILWSDANQLIGDSIFLYTNGEAIDRMELFNSAFIIEKVDTVRFNQIRGKNLIGYFKGNEIYRIDVKGNAENIYYAVEEQKIFGVNQGTCAYMNIYLKDGKISDIYMFQNPDGSLDPPLLRSGSERRFDSFKWYDYLRPRNRHDIFRKENN